MNRAAISLMVCIDLGFCGGAGAQDWEAVEWEPAQAPIMTRWTADVSPEHAHPEYPRPHMVRSEWLSLNGLWQFEPIVGGHVEPPTGRDLDRWILVPFPIESALSGVMEHHDRVWYRRVFEVPAEWRGRRVILHFGAVDWEARVWVNGAEVGAHRGGYDPFSFDITDALAEEGAQEIIVGVFDPTDAGTQPRGKQVLRPEGIWYTPTTGIWQTVWLEPVPQPCEALPGQMPEGPPWISDVSIIPDVKTSRVMVVVEVPPFREGRSQCFVQVRVLDHDGLVGEGFGAVGEPVAVPIAEPRLWSPESPYLYQLEIALASKQPPQAQVDHVQSYFAMRTISVDKDEAGTLRLFLNGEPYFMVGTLDQGFWPDGLYTAPTDEALRFDIEKTKAMGFNTIRKHVKVEPARWYYWCDVLGILVWQDMPSGDAYIGGDDADLVRSEESAKQFERELRAMIESLRNHPSIVMWVPFNEGWGQFDTGRITDFVREIDPTRLVNSTSGWTDRGTGDVHDIHVYPGPGAPAIEEKRAGVLGEFGGLGLAIEGHTWSDTAWGYRGMQDEQELAHRYEQLMRGVYELKEKAGLAAAIYTQTTDVETETNGLITFDRAVMKVDPARIAAANRGEFAPLRMLVPSARDDRAIEWRFTLEEPAVEWMAADFDDSSWKAGRGGFGTAGTPGAIIGTEWTTGEIWVRRTFELSEVPAGDVRLFIHHDEDATVYLNGVLAAELSGYTTTYEDVLISENARNAMRNGPNTIAIHSRQTRGGQYIDAGLVRVMPHDHQSRE